MNFDTKLQSLKMGVSEAQQRLHRWPQSKQAQDEYVAACERLNKYKEMNRGRNSTEAAT